MEYTVHFQRYVNGGPDAIGQAPVKGVGDAEEAEEQFLEEVKDEEQYEVTRVEQSL